MKTASVADLRNRFAKVSKWIAKGERVTITKRGRPFAVIQSVEDQSAPPPVDRRARLKALNPDGPVPGDVMDLLQSDREER